jgi:hypothetical protein
MDPGTVDAILKQGRPEGSPRRQTTKAAESTQTKAPETKAPAVNADDPEVQARVKAILEAKAKKVAEEKAAAAAAAAKKAAEESEAVKKLAEAQAAKDAALATAAEAPAAAPVKKAIDMSDDELLKELGIS